MKLARNFKEFIIDYLPYLYAIHDLIIKNKIFFSKKSYAHTEEDLFILKKFKNKKGFYVDVGCHHPTRLNNCHLLYKNGWNGINIDISKFTIKLFNLVRRKDVNINIAVSLKQKKVRFYYDKLISFYISLNKRKELDRFREVNSDTLTKIIDKTRYKNRKIDFLSIDTEGKDFEVLRSLNLKKYDPKYVCIEIYSDKNVNFNIKKNPIYKYLIKKNYKLLFNKRENYIFKKKL
jgi:FkbM family methyltransferase